MLVVEAATIKYEHTCSRIGEGENPNVLQVSSALLCLDVGNNGFRSFLASSEQSASFTFSPVHWLLP
jgi:hypothetical protein